MSESHTKSVTDPLTQRELEILHQVAEGQSNQAIASHLFITLGTVKWYLKQIYSKLDVSSRTQAIAVARSQGLLGENVANTEPPAPPHNLPYQTTPFIGREQELTDLAHLLADDNVRLLTILALGGMGKTRLALAIAARQLRQFADGVYFVPLAPLSSPDDIVTTIAEQVGFSFYGDEPAQRQLFGYFRKRHTLLVLDNFEHLLNGVSLIIELLQTAPQVKVLVTSREKLNLIGETVFSLGGLHFPDEAFLDYALGYDAVRLFMHSAHRVRSDFELQAGDLGSLLRICRLTGGMPLGLVLAAGWLDVMSLVRIADEIQSGIDFLETEQRDVPERQRSVRATFNTTWARLTEVERDVFMRLSVFRGGFTPDAAALVAGADTRTLRRMASKALVQVLPGDRYEVHELLRQSGEEQLNSSPQMMERIQESHRDYYAAYMRRQWQALMSLRQGVVFDEIGIEFNNVLEAWKYAIRKCHARTFSDMLLSFWYYCDFRVPRPQVAKLVNQAVEALQTGSGDRDTEIALGQMLALRGWNYTDDLPNPAFGKACAEQSLAILRKRDDCPEAMVFALNTLACVAGFVMGQFTDGLQAAEEGARIAREHDIQWGLGHCLLHIGYNLYAQGDLVHAREIGEACARVSESIGNVWTMAGCAVHLLGLVAISMEDYAEAEKQFELGLRWYKTLDEHCWGVAVACGLLGKVALLTHHYEKARYWLQQSLDYHIQTGRREREYYEALYNVCQLLAAQGNLDMAVEILASIQQQPLAYSVRDLAAASLIELEASLAEETLVTALERSKSLDLHALARDFLTL